MAMALKRSGWVTEVLPMDFEIKYLSIKFLRKNVVFSSGLHHLGPPE